MGICASRLSGLFGDHTLEFAALGRRKGILLGLFLLHCPGGPGLAG